MRYADIEIIVAQDPGGTTAGLRVELPNRRADLVAPTPIALDEETLLSLANDPAAYGAALKDMLFAPPLREAWQRTRGFAEADGASLRVRLALDGGDALHAIRWELLRDPVANTPLAHAERVPLARFVASASLDDVQAPSRPRLRAVVAVASPSALPSLGMTPLDVGREMERAREGLGPIPVDALDGQEGRPAATLPALAAALRGGAQILYVVCHGALVAGQPYLYLEQEEEPYRPVSGEAVVAQITQLERRPLLVVLAACRGAGDTYAALAAIGPRLAQAGVGAVIAMQGDVPAEMAGLLAARLFAELRRDGRIDRALAAARAALPADSPWWTPVLWMAVKDGALWREPAPWRRVATIVAAALVPLALTLAVLRMLGGAGEEQHYVRPPVQVGVAELADCGSAVAQQLRDLSREAQGVAVAFHQLGPIKEAAEARSQTGLDLVLWGGCPGDHTRLSLHAELLDGPGVSELAEPERVDVDMPSSYLDRADRLAHALIAYLGGDFAGAASSLQTLREEAAGRDEEAARLALLEGNSRLLSREDEAAIELYGSAAAYPPLAAYALNNRGLARTGLALEYRSNPGRYIPFRAAAWEDLRAAAAEPTLHARALANQAALAYFMDRSMLASAEPICTQVITLEPELPSGFLCRAAARSWQIQEVYNDPARKCGPVLSTDLAYADLKDAEKALASQLDANAYQRDLAQIWFYRGMLADFQADCDRNGQEQQRHRRESDAAFRKFLRLADGAPGLMSDRYLYEMTPDRLKSTPSPQR